MTAIHQFVSKLYQGDGVGSNVRANQTLFRGAGYDSEIFTIAADDACANLRRPLESYEPKRGDRLILQHCHCAPELVRFFSRLPGRKAVLYQNVTPARFFVDPTVAAQMDIARTQLIRLAESAELGLAPSEFSRAELDAAGFEWTESIPMLSEHNVAEESETAMLRSLADGRYNILFVGRIAPNKRQDECVRALAAYRAINPHARLVLAGSYESSSSYCRYLRLLIARLGLREHVRFTGHVTPAQLRACYDAAQVFLSLSEHEGFGIPLVEAMRSAVPVVAFDAGAVSDTLGGAGLLSRSKDAHVVARLLHLVASDASIRQPLISAGLRRAGDFDTATAGPQVLAKLAAFVGDRNRTTVTRLPRLKTRSKVVFVIQRYGIEVNGGAELLARLVAERLANHVEVEVLTTTAVDYQTWGNDYPAGPSVLNGVRVRRFPVDQPRDLEPFTRFTGEIFPHELSEDDEVAWIEQQGPMSSALLTAIEASRADTALYVFFTYLYHPTIVGLPKVGDRSVLVPTLHDEPALRLRLLDGVVAAPRALVCLTEEEAALARKRFDVLPREIHVAGLGIDPPAAHSPEAFKAKHGLTSYFLYVGRVDKGKGCPQLIEAYRHYREQMKAPWDLVLAGQVSIDLPSLPGLKALGFVSDEDRDDALHGARALIVSSPYESLSLVALEGMSLGLPVVVNGKSAVLRGHVQRSGAGTCYEGPDDLAQRLVELHNSNAPRTGDRGPEYVRTHYSWERVDSLYLDLIRRFGALKQGDRRDQSA